MEKGCSSHVPHQEMLQIKEILTKCHPKNINVNIFNPKSWTNEISHVVFWTIITLEWCTITC